MFDCSLLRGILSIGSVEVSTSPKAHDRSRRQDRTFYHDVFGWTLRGDPDHPRFDAGTGRVIGTWVTDLPIVDSAGIRPYIYVCRPTRRDTAPDPGPGQ